MSGIVRGNAKDNSRRKHTGGGPRPDNNAYKRESARERSKAWSELSPEKQIADLDVRLGRGEGARRQRARIQYTIQQRQNAAKALTQSTSETHTPAKPKAKERREHERAQAAAQRH